MSDKCFGPVGSSFEVGHVEIRNNNRFAQDSLTGDANANDIQSRECRTLGGFTSHCEQDKIIIWGTDSQCDDPELAEFEMLECQELEAYLVESEENYVKDVEPGACSSQTKVEIPTEISNNEDSHVDVNESQSVSHNTISRTAETGFTRAQCSSDNDVFVSCYSTMSNLGGSLASALDNTSRSQTTAYWPAPTEPYRTLSDLTLPLSEEPLTEAQENQPVQFSTVTCKETSSQSRSGINECKPSTADAEIKHNVIRNTSEDKVGQHGNSTVEQAIIKEECKHPKTVSALKKSHQPFGSEATESPLMGSEVTQSPLTGSEATDSPLTDSRFLHDYSHEQKRQSSQSHETPDKSLKVLPGSVGLPIQGVPARPRPYQTQTSFERSHSVSLDRHRPWRSPPRAVTSPSHNPTGSPRRQAPTSPAKTRAPPQDPASSPQRSIRGLKPPSKSYLSSGIPKPIPPQYPTKTEPDCKKSPPARKPKNVHSKIITSVRKSPQVQPLSAEGLYETSTLPSRLTAYPSTSATKERRAGEPKGSPVLSSSSVLYDKYRQELQKAGYYSPPGPTISGVRRPSNTVPQKLLGKSESFHGVFPERHLNEVGDAALCRSPEVSGVCRSPRPLPPQLCLGNRQPAAKSRALVSGQRSASPLSHKSPLRQDSFQNLPGEQKKRLLAVSSRSFLTKPGGTGLYPPPRMAAFGYIRSSSVSTVSSSQSNNSAHSDPLRPSSPVRKGLQKDKGCVTESKRCAMVSPKPQSPVRQKSCVVRVGVQVEGVTPEWERLQVQRLRERCEGQDAQISFLQMQLLTATLCMDALAVTTQHFCSQVEHGALKERELSLELCRIRDEVAVAVHRWECLRGQKEELELCFQEQLKELRVQEQKELQAVQERLRQELQENTEQLQEQQSSRLEQLRTQHHRQVEEMTQGHETTLQEMEAAHNATLATLQEEHSRTLRNLTMAHTQEKKSLEEEFEKLRLTLQDQVDTLTFQNHSLRDRAKRFEEALRRSTDEQIVDALAPYQHIEEDLKSLKEVLEMKNQQIHDQQLKISELERMAQKNVLLEERVQVLQQQNEDLKARVDLNLAVSRQLSEENANLQEYVEKETNEKKRLSRTNEELLWRLQTGELSPHLSPNQSPLHRPPVDSSSPTRLPPCPP